MEPSFQDLPIRRQTQKMGGDSSVPLQNRFGDPLRRLKPQMTSFEMEKESVSFSRHSLQSISRKHDDVCIFGSLMGKWRPTRRLFSQGDRRMHIC